MVFLSNVRFPSNSDVESCAVCHSPTFFDLPEINSVYDRTRTYSLVRCSACGLTMTFPKPSVEELQKIYATSYGYAYHNLTANERKLRAVKLIKSLDLQSFGQCTEIGFGEGQFLLAMRKFGSQVGGCELNASSVARVVSLLGRESNVQVSDADSYLENSSGLSGLVVLNHVLEHLPDAEATLRLIAQKMDSRGKLLIVVPNTESAPKGKLRKFWGYWQVPVHLNHYNLNSLSLILDKSGFAVERAKFKGLDFLSFGLFFLNLAGTPGSSVAAPGVFTRNLIRGLSTIWPIFYHFGKSDLILLASQKT